VLEVLVMNIQSSNDEQNNRQNNEPASSRSKLIYDYTEKLYKLKSDNIDLLNTRLGVILGVSGGLLKFVFDLPSKDLVIQYLPCNTCFAFKLLACGLTFLAIFVTVYGLQSKAIGVLVQPRKLMTSEWYEKPEEKQRAYIINSWVEAIDEFTLSAQKKSKALNHSIALLIVALIFFFLDNLFPLLG